MHHGEVLGGAPTSLLNTILGLKELGEVEIKVLCVNDEMKRFFQEKADVEVGDISYPCKAIGKALIGWTNFYSRNTWLDIFKELIRIRSIINIQAEQLKQENPDIIHLNSAILFVTALAARKLHVPVIWHVREILHGGRFNVRKMFAGWFIRKFADKVIAISPADAKSLGKDAYHNVEVVYNFVDFSKFDSSLYDQREQKAKFGVRHDEKLVVSLGGFSWRKGTLELLEAMKHVNGKVKLIINRPDTNIGKKEFSKIGKKGLSKFKNMKLAVEDVLSHIGLKRFRRSEYMYRISKALGDLKNNNVMFTGPLDEVVPLLAACDLLAAPHTIAHFSRPVFEAWTMKKPVIAFDMPGISENIDDDNDGIVVKTDSSKALGKAINSIINNETQLKKMGEEGYSRADTYFRLERNVAKIWSIYQELVR